ncbi:MAG: glycosyl hydrolase family 65 protein, partial [Flavobacteriaceae bacterium]
DVGGNVKDGAHIASMGGTWMAVVYGFAGLRDYGGKISFNPKIPKQADDVSFLLTIRGQLLKVNIKKDKVTYSLKKGEDLTIYHEEKEIKLTSDQPIKIINLLTKV